MNFQFNGVWNSVKSTLGFQFNGVWNSNSIDSGCDHSLEWLQDNVWQRGGTPCPRNGPVNLVGPPSPIARSHTGCSYPAQLSLTGKAVSLSLGDLHLWKIFISISPGYKNHWKKIISKIDKLLIFKIHVSEHAIFNAWLS